MTITPTDDVPAPAGATHVFSWSFDPTDDEKRWRLFHGTKRGDIGAQVDIIGTQAGDGTVAQRLIVVRHGGARIAFSNAAAARETARNLLAAADELDALNESI
jgi:hypothetical protein